MGLLDRIKHGWNAFVNNRDPTMYYNTMDLGQSYFTRPDRVRLSGGNEKTVVTAITNRIALDVADVDIRHVVLDEEGRFNDYYKSGLDYCLNTEANIDQTHKDFIQDIVMSMIDEGVVAVVPVDTDVDPTKTGSYDIKTMRTGKIIQWYPRHVKIKLYNDRTGKHEDVTLPKESVAIIQNPFYAVMNEPNSTMKRLVKKLTLLDAIDEQSGSGKLDLIIQLPYIVKSEARREQAEKRRKDIEVQLSGSKYGIAYTDGTERITQLNRPVENNLLKQIEYLTSMLYSQLSFHQSILDGTADEKTMLNYTNRTVKVMVMAIVNEFKRKFLTKTARSQNQSISYFRDPFALMPASELAKTADTLTRNEILTKNEIRQIMGRKPSTDPKADKLINSNISHPEGEAPTPVKEVTEEPILEGENQNGA